jgi:hypothetical protein
MSHSTHVGFNCPLTTDLGVEESPVSAASVRLIPACAFEWALFRLPDPLESPAVGVGHRLTDTFNGSLFRFHWLGPASFFAS